MEARALMEMLLPWFAPLIAAIALAHSLYSHHASARAKKLAAIERKIATTGERVTSVEGRVSKIENDLEHMPDKDSTHRLEMSMADMNTELRVLAERIKPVAAVSERLQELLMERVPRL